MWILCHRFGYSEGKNRIDIKKSDLSKLLNGVKLETKENNDLYNIYCDEDYSGAYAGAENTRPEFNKLTSSFSYK